jgi:hypothetical protein
MDSGSRSRSLRGISVVILLVVVVVACHHVHRSATESLPDGGSRTIYAAEPTSRTPRINLGSCYLLRDLRGRYAVLRFDSDFTGRLPNGQSTTGEKYTCIVQDDGSGEMGRGSKWSGDVYETDPLQLAFGPRDAGWFGGGKTQVDCGPFHPMWSVPEYLYFATVKEDAWYEIAETRCTELEAVNVFDRELVWKREERR